MEQELTKAEEQLMKYLWQKGSLYMKELLLCYTDDPKPAVTTLATLLKRMQQKGFVGYELMGNSRRYYPMIKKEDYFTDQVGDIVTHFFDNSALQFASFFTRKGGLSAAELNELQQLIQDQIKNKNEQYD